MSSYIKVTQIKSTIAKNSNNKRVLEGLGLKGIGKTKVHKDNNCIRGMVNKVKHYVRYELISK